MQQANFHHVNMLADRPCEDLRQQGTQMLVMVQASAITDHKPPIVDVQPPLQPTANTVLQNSVQIEILRLLREISTECRGGQGGKGRGSGDNNGLDHGYGLDYGESNRNSRTPDNTNVAPCITNSYCWTHRVCNHASVECTRKAPAHKDDAARDSCMGGSNAFVKLMWNDGGDRRSDK